MPCPYTGIQVMSESVAKGLLQVVGSEAEGTAEMIMLVDKMFDCLNVTNCSEGIRKRKPSKDPYTHAGDWRLKVCQHIYTCYRIPQLYIMHVLA